MSKKQKVYMGNIDSFQNNEIHINVNHLENGTYLIKIMHKNKVVKQTLFKK